MREYDNFLLTLSRSLILNSTDELPMVVNQVTEKVCKFLDCDRVSIWLYQGNKEAIKCESLFLKASATHEKDLVLSKADYQDYFLALENERIIEANDAITHPATSCFAESYLNPLGIKSMYDTPIWKVNDVVGVLCLEYTNQKKVWDIKEKSFFTSLADFLAKIYEKLAVLEVVESLDQKVTERTAQLNQALEDIKVTQKNLLEQERLASLGTVIAGISHEIRNPLNIIHSASQAIQEVLDEDDSYPQEIYKFAEMIHNATHRTNSIIHDMLDISADRKKAIPTDINHLISYCLQLVRHSLIEPQKLNIKITQDLAQINQKILLPRQEIQRVLVNIIENAVQSMVTKTSKLSSRVIN